MIKEQTEFDYNDIGCIQLLSNESLIKIALGKVDMKKIAKEIMAGRGFDKRNEWVGSAKAESEWSFE
jgi:hypothetical protein